LKDRVPLLGEPALQRAQGTVLRASGIWFPSLEGLEVGFRVIKESRYHMYGITILWFKRK